MRSSSPRIDPTLPWSEQWSQAIVGLRSDLGYENSAEQLRLLIKTGLLRLDDLRHRPSYFFEAHRLLAQHAPRLGPGFWIRFTVHYNLCFGSVLAVGSDEQVRQLEDVQGKGLLGCFALTEKKALVNSGMVVQTAAERDDAKSEFVIDSPLSGLMKIGFLRALLQM